MNNTEKLWKRVRELESLVQELTSRVEYAERAAKKNKQLYAYFMAAWESEEDDKMELEKLKGISQPAKLDKKGLRLIKGGLS